MPGAGLRTVRTGAQRNEPQRGVALWERDRSRSSPNGAKYGSQGKVFETWQTRRKSPETATKSIPKQCCTEQYPASLAAASHAPPH